MVTISSSTMQIYIWMLLLILMSATCQAQEWTWLNGRDTADVASSYLGPGSRSGSSLWRDTNGDVWLFGGKGFSDLGTGSPILLNDLWKYDISKNVWKVMHPGTVSMTGMTHSLNSESPPPRHLGSGCGVTNLTFVIYGGISDDDVPFGDTWVYYIVKQTWLMLGEELKNTTLDGRNVENKSNFISPPSRGAMVSWCMYDSLIVFSGRDKGLNLLKDMWQLSLRTLVWKQLGNTTIDDSSNPGKDTHDFLPRQGAVTWVNRKDLLYMFGGNIRTSKNYEHTVIGYLSDMWHFNLTQLSWTLLAGSTQPHKHGVYGNVFTSKSENMPGSRQGGAVWVDTADNLWLFGGDGMDKYPKDAFRQSKLLSDLWKFDISHQMWTWMGGSDVGEAPVRYSTKGKVSRKALIGGRCSASVWTGSDNKFYIFGGIGHDSHQHDGYLNDLWLIDVNELVKPSQNSVSVGSFVIFTFLIITIILIVAVTSLFTRDRDGISILNRFEHNIKYSHLSTTGD